MTGSVPTLLWVVNAVSWAGKILRKNATGDTRATPRRSAPLITNAWKKQQNHVSPSSPSSDQNSLPRLELRPTVVAVIATIAYGVSRIT